MSGEDKDPESGRSHIGHVICNAMFIDYMMREMPQYDDRFKGFEEETNQPKI
jgi:hypothetical protein